MAKMQFFDANGRFGTSLKSHCGFPAAADLIRHLDHLGIARALAFNVEGREGGCSYVNRKTLAEINRAPGGKERLIPAFSISPVMMYPEGALKELRRMVEAHAPVLHFTRGLTECFLSECAPIFDLLKDLKPMVFLNFKDSERHDLLKTAGQYPDMTLVLTDLAWGTMAHVLDLMARCPNICVETCWLHTADDLEILCERFGPERVFFGAGERANYGASMAALVHADIPAKSKEMIAHSNLERRLGLAPAGTITLGQSRLKDNQLWQRLVAGQPLPVPVIDAHIHLGASGGYVIKHNDLDSQIPGALALADRIGVQTMIVSSINALIGEPVSEHEILAEKLAPHGERFRCYVGFNPKHADALAARFDTYFRQPLFVGFKTLCDYWQVPITDPRFEPMFVYADRHRLPILNHTWDTIYDSPKLFTELAEKYPGAQIILGHSGGGNKGRREAEELASKHANVWLEWCGSFCCTIPWEESFTRVDPGKMIFGSDAFLHNLRWELGRLLSMDIPETQLKPMLGDTMRGILAMRR